MALFFQIIVDWSQFWPSLIATFLGVIAAIFVQKKYEDWKEKREAEEFEKKIYSELTLISQRLKDISIKIDNNLLLYPLDFPVYKGLIASGKISLINRYSWYELFLEIYNNLEIYNAWHTYRTYTGISKNSEIIILLHKIESKLLSDKTAETSIAYLLTCMSIKKKVKKKSKRLKNE